MSVFQLLKNLFHNIVPYILQKDQLNYSCTNSDMNSIMAYYIFYKWMYTETDLDSETHICHI